MESDAGISFGSIQKSIDINCERLRQEDWPSLPAALTQTSHPRIRVTKGSEASRAKSRDTQAGHLSFMTAFFRYASARRRLRHPDRTGVARSP